MGSYLTIVNDTQDTWQCKVGSDEAALMISGIITGIIGLGFAGAGVIVGTGLITVSDIAAETVKQTVQGANAVSGFTKQMTDRMSESLSEKGFVVLKPGERHQTAKMTLSLWQQGTCVKGTVRDGTHVTFETLYMRPIFTGATDNSNIDHSIQWWINKWGTEKMEVVANVIP